MIASTSLGNSVGSPLPKSGHLAFETGIRVADHIADRVAEKEAEAPLELPNAICFASFNAEQAMEVNVAATWDDFLEEIKRKPKAFKPPPRGVKAAEEWSTSVWDQLLG